MSRISRTFAIRVMSVIFFKTEASSYYGVKKEEKSWGMTSKEKRILIALTLGDICNCYVLRKWKNYWFYVLGGRFFLVYVAWKIHWNIILKRAIIPLTLSHILMGSLKRQWNQCLGMQTIHTMYSIIP